MILKANYFEKVPRYRVPQELLQKCLIALVVTRVTMGSGKREDSYTSGNSSLSRTSRREKHFLTLKTLLFEVDRHIFFFSLNISN
jgi:hypothetical protein